MDKIRCSNCRGMKQVAKLGGMLGDCNLCLGTGLIDVADKPKMVSVATVEPVADIVSQVASIVPKAIKIEKEKEPIAVVDVVEAEKLKAHSKKAIYKRKQA